ncbi:MAG: DUF1588 domain-containing protein [Myxococcota bacterium]
MMAPFPRALLVRWTLLPTCVVGLAACQGLVLGGEVEPPGEVSPPEVPPPRQESFECAPNARPESPPLPRLTRTQLETSVRRFLAALIPEEAAAVEAAATVQSALATVPLDQRVRPDPEVRVEHSGGIRRADQTVTAQHVEGIFELGAAIGAEVAERLESALGACAADGDPSNDRVCVTEFIARAGRLAHRRELTADEATFYTEVYDATGIDEAGIADVVAVMVAGPHFYYRVEHGTDPVEGQPSTFAVEGEELAARLSLHFWDGPPDETLLAMDLGTDAGYREAVAYVVDHPRAEPVVRQFFTEWLSLESLPEMDGFASAPNVSPLLGDISISGDTREHMIADAAGLALHYARSERGTLEDIFTSRLSFATTSDVAALYGVEPWSGEGDPPELPAERTGILTRVAYLASGRSETRPIIKGVHIRSSILCDELPAPPDEAQFGGFALMNEPGNVHSTREQYEALTEDPETVCVGCHRQIINPMGFLTENFGPFGQLRDREAIYDPEDGSLMGEAPIDTRVVPVVTLGDDRAIETVRELVPLLMESGRPHRCVARNYFRHTFQRFEDDEVDGCALLAVERALSEGTIADAMAQIAFTPAFRQRRFD